MSANEVTQVTPQEPSKKKRSRKAALLIVTGIFIIIAIAYLIYWFLVLRHFQDTDDAYVAGNQVQIMAQVSGSVTSVNFDNTDFVKKGDTLVIVDPTDAEQAFEKAKTALASSVRQTHQSMINSKQYQANIALRTTQLNQAQTDLKRRVVLGQLDAIGREELQHAHDAVDSAKAQLDVAQQQYNANQAVVLNTPLDQQPQVLQAAAQVRDAWLSLQRTKIVSPVEKSALYDEAVESYNQTILNAVQQTADAITIQKSSAEQLQLASSAVQALKDAYRVMSDRYQAGTVGRDQLLDRQSQLLQQQQAEITASSNLLQAKISLIRALGGGYQAPAAESKS